MIQQLKIRSNTFVLHPGKVVWWAEQHVLLLADVHLGKITHFRKHGSALPKGAIAENFNRLNAVIERYDPLLVCFLGDLFHSYQNQEFEQFATWRQGIDREMMLVTGNHDVISPHQFDEIEVDTCPEWRNGEFLLTHHPTDDPDAFNFCGHIHPAVRLVGEGKQRLTLPCFFQRPRQLILPAFGEFTGVHVMTPEEGDRVFVVADGEVVGV